MATIYKEEYFNDGMLDIPALELVVNAVKQIEAEPLVDVKQELAIQTANFIGYIDSHPIHDWAKSYFKKFLAKQGLSISEDDIENQIVDDDLDEELVELNSEGMPIF